MHPPRKQKKRNGMRKTALVLNAIVIVFFLCFLVYTFVARQHLNSLAREFVTEKTLAYSKPIVEFADEALDSPLVKKFLSKDQETAIRNEIAGYQNDPHLYIADLTRQQVRAAANADMKENPLIEKVASIKSKIRTYYDDTLNALITDLRIFAISNLVAALIAFALAYRSPVKIRKPIVWFSILIFVAVLYCSYLYIDDLTFFRILFQAHLGWGYAVILSVMIAGLLHDSQILNLHRQNEGTEQDSS